MLSDKETQVLSYLDFSRDALTNLWTHVSCIYDGPHMQLRGTYFYGDQSFAYYEDLEFRMDLPVNSYLLYVNTDPRQGIRGLQKAYYSEVKFWRYARPLALI